MNIEWIEYRIKESNGFVSGRLFRHAIFVQQLKNGVTFCMPFQKCFRILTPEMVYSPKITMNKMLSAFYTKLSSEIQNCRDETSKIVSNYQPKNNLTKTLKTWYL